MSSRPLHSPNYRPQFSGHETFPLRYGWLKKAYDRVAETESKSENRLLCWGEEAIARFGVGKNMVNSIRYWSNSCGIIEECANGSKIKTTALGRSIFESDGNGLDPYLENPSTLWLMHWNLASNPKKTTWYWAFNHYTANTFSRNLFVQKIENFAKEHGWVRCSLNTIKNDVACFIRSYCVSQINGRNQYDSVLESPLSELGIIKPLDDKDGYRIVRGSKPSLGDGLFIYALLDFWSGFTHAKTLSFEAITYEPGSPGRVFSLGEEDIIDRLSNLGDKTKKKLRWSETAGLKQVVRNCEFDDRLKFSFLFSDYPKQT